MSVDDLVSFWKRTESFCEFSLIDLSPMLYAFVTAPFEFKRFMHSSTAGESIPSFEAFVIRDEIIFASEGFSFI